MVEETGESSIIQWALENNAEKLKPWCFIDKDGNLDGPLAKRFEQAIRLEGTKRSQGKHPSGIIIAPEALDGLCPMVYDTKTKTQICGMEMGDLEAIGLVKFDILGISYLSKVEAVQSLIRTRKIR